MTQVRLARARRAHTCCTSDFGRAFEVERARETCEGPTSPSATSAFYGSSLLATLKRASTGAGRAAAARAGAVPLRQFAPVLHVARGRNLWNQAHLLARTRAGEEAVRRDQPVAPRRGDLHSQDLDPVAAARGLQRHDAAVDPAPLQRCPTSCARGRRNRAGSRHGQIHHLAPGVSAYTRSSTSSLSSPPCAVGAGLEQLPHPFDPARQRGVVAGAAFLIAPVRGHASSAWRCIAGADLPTVFPRARAPRCAANGSRCA